LAESGNIMVYRGKIVPPGSVWRCPCGREGDFPSVLGHRHGWKNRPECGPGDIYIVSPGTDDGDPTHSPFMHRPQEGQADEQPDAAPRPARQASEYTGEIPPSAESGEDVAEFLLRQRHGGAVPTTPLPPNGPTFAPIRRNGNGKPPDGGEPPFDDLPPGDWLLEPPGTVDGTVNKVQVTLPVGVVVVYDWFRADGWGEGDGTLNTWVNSVVWDWIRFVARKALTVIDREEVEAESG
jgi:hypothetical protein